MTHDYQHCGGPEYCAYCAAILGETPERACERMTEEDRERGFRSAGTRGELRTGIPYEPPNPYEAGLAKLRAGLPTNRWPEPQTAPPLKPGDYTPPDPYAAALAVMKENR